MTFKVTYRCFDLGKWRTAYRIIQANSKEDAIKKMDLWPQLIKSVEEI